MVPPAEKNDKINSWTNEIGHRHAIASRPYFCCKICFTIQIFDSFVGFQIGTMAQNMQNPNSTGDLLDVNSIQFQMDHVTTILKIWAVSSNARDCAHMFYNAKYTLGKKCIEFTLTPKFDFQLKIGQISFKFWSKTLKIHQ